MSKEYRPKPATALLRATRVLYDTLRAYSAVNETDGQPLAPPWHKASDEMVFPLTSNLLVYLVNPDAPDHLLHTLATEEYRRDGWTYGPENPVAKTSPLLCRFDQLPSWMQDMNRLTKAVADALRPTIPPDELRFAVDNARAATKNSVINALMH